MDPGTLLNEGSFANAIATSYNLAEIWQFPMNGGGVNVAESGCELGLKRPLFGHDLAQFGDVSDVSWEVSANDPMNLDNKGSQGGENGGNGIVRKRRNAEEDSPKGVSTSSGNGVVFLLDIHSISNFISFLLTFQLRARNPLDCPFTCGVNFYETYLGISCTIDKFW